MCRFDTNNKILQQKKIYKLFPRIVFVFGFEILIGLFEG
jgi:hypothetical protein